MRGILIWRTALFLSLVLVGGNVLAGPPLKHSLVGLPLGSEFAQIEGWAKARFPICRLVRIPYEASDAGSPSVIETYTINDEANDGDRRCRAAQEAKGYMERWRIDMTHPRAPNGRRAWIIEMQRFFEISKDPVQPIQRRQVVDELTREFGPPSFMGPTNAQKQELASNIELDKKLVTKPLGPTPVLRREYIYWGSSPFNVSKGFCDDCHGLTASVEITTKYLTGAQIDAEEVVSIKMAIADMEAGVANAAWLQQFRDSKKANPLKF